MKKLIFVLLTLVLAFGFFVSGSDSRTGWKPVSGVEDLESITAECAIVLDEKTGALIYEKDAGRRMFPASTTKILTALLAMEYGDMDEIVVVGDEANRAKADASKAGLDFGEKISLGNLLKGLMLPSGNDAAFVIAVHIARKASGDMSLKIDDALDRFCDMMNVRAREAGAVNSHFVNPDGYHDDNHYSTARDIAMIAREAMKYPFFREVVKMPEFRIRDWKAFDKNNAGQVEIRRWVNTNRLILKGDRYFYEYATGLKTGHTRDAGFCLVSSASKKDKSVIAVVLKSTEQKQWEDSVKLLQYGLLMDRPG